MVAANNCDSLNDTRIVPFIKADECRPKILVHLQPQSGTSRGKRVFAGESLTLTGGHPAGGWVSSLMCGVVIKSGETQKDTTRGQIHGMSEAETADVCLQATE